MIKYENECVGCPPERGCLGSSCPYINVPRLYCDVCGEEDEELYEYDDEQLCADCLRKKFKLITVEDYI